MVCISGVHGNGRVDAVSGRWRTANDAKVLSRAVGSAIDSGMFKRRTSGARVTRAAGGLLWRTGPAGYEIAVIRREKYQDWTLPKGKLDPGESWEAAAIREVREETGFKAKLLGFAGAAAYSTDKGPKIVRYWHMEPLGAP